ncbi:MAG: hypothetical protein FJY85_25810, partial [Deltaproteobacteria bacterium]|nr:hypothetical protein [Deltaproteobacteria bacterium]
MSIVPNQFPTIADPHRRLAIIGEAPGENEDKLGLPFVGASGQLLTDLLSRNNILRNACFIGNVCQVRPLGNDIFCLDWYGDEIQNGIKQLEQDLARFEPTMCLLLGSSALRAFIGHADSITKWRGSLFIAGPSSPRPGVKCLASYHPAAIFRNYEWRPILHFDIARTAQESCSPGLVLPDRVFHTNLSPAAIIERLDQISLTKPTIALDIEGGVNSLSCISIATAPTEAFIIPFTRANGSHFTEEDELQVWTALSKVLRDPDIPKVLQNSLYDNFVLSYSYQT